VAHQINQLHHADSGVTWKTLANYKANTKAALFWFRNEQGLAPRGSPLDPKWKKLRRSLKDLSRLAKLSSLIRYCSLKGILPAAINESVVDGYMAYRKETTALAVDNKARRAIARAWNASRTIEHWPQQQLIEPPLKAKEGPRWEDFPLQLQADVAAHLKFLATHRRAQDGKRLRPCKANTLRTRRPDLVAFAKKAIRLGTPIKDLSSLSALLAPKLVDRVLDSEWAQNGDEPKTSTIDLAKKLVAVARSSGCLTTEQLKELDDKRAALEQYRKEGMTSKNLKLIRQVLNSEVWARTIQPRSCSALLNLARPACPCASLSAFPNSTPIRRMPLGCCARAASGHVAAPLRSAMNSRRFILSYPVRAGSVARPRNTFPSFPCL
jgi:hypothetical protein